MTQESASGFEPAPGFLHDQATTLRAVDAGGALVSTFTLVLEEG